MSEKKYKYGNLTENEKQIADCNKDAMESGLSYGQYVAGIKSNRTEKSTDRVEFWWKK